MDAEIIVNRDDGAPSSEPPPPLGSVEIAPPALSRWREGTDGVDYVHTFRSGRAGPHVMLSAIVHGNELCGAIVLDELLRAGVRPARGRLTLAFANVEACSRFDANHPLLSRYVDEDLNRLWSGEMLDGRRVEPGNGVSGGSIAATAELRRARALRPLLDEVDYLLDLHSMQYEGPPLVLCGPARKGEAFARALGLPGHIVRDVGHEAGTRMRDYAAFTDEASPRNSILLECGQHWRHDTVEVARRAVFRFLAHFGIASPPPPGGRPPPLPGDGLPARIIEITDRVTVRSHRFRFTGPYRGMEVVERAGTVIGHDGDEPVVTPCDECVLILPSHRPARGSTAVRLGRFVDSS